MVQNDCIMTRPAFRLRAVTVIAALVGTAMVVAGLGKPTNPNVAIGERVGRRSRRR